MAKKATNVEVEDGHGQSRLFGRKLGDEDFCCLQESQKSELTKDDTIYQRENGQKLGGVKSGRTYKGVVSRAEVFVEQMSQKDGGCLRYQSIDKGNCSFHTFNERRGRAIP